MRFFELLGMLHIFMYLFPALGFILVFGATLGYSHFRSQDHGQRMEQVVHTYPGGFESRNAPFPLAMVGIIAATAVWGFFYILFIGMFRVAI